MPKEIKLKDIARALGISIGTVDRALHDRPGINPKTRQQVLASAEKMGYRPNLAASMLRTKRKLRIAINLPQEIASFWGEVRSGIELEQTSTAQGSVELVNFPFPRLGQGEAKSLNAALRAEVHGIITLAGVSNESNDRLREVIMQGLPVVFVGSTMENLTGLATVSINPRASGSLAAELIGRFGPSSGSISIVTGDMRVPDHSEKLDSFRQTVKQYFPGLTVLPPLEAYDDPIEARAKFSKLLKSVDDLIGCYVTTANSLSVLEAVQMLKKPPVTITTDLFPELIPYLHADRVAATIYQRPRTQGQIAFRTLFDYLAKGMKPTGNVQLIPQLVLRSNIELFHPIEA